MKILFISPEGLPYSKTGGLADVVGALPEALTELGHEVAVLLPKYRGTKTRPPIIPSVTVALGSFRRFPAIAEGEPSGGIRYFFVDDPAFFDREFLYGDKTGDYPDNPERFAEFSLAALEFAKQAWRPDVFHCHDWQTALVPTFLRTLYVTDPVLRDIPVVFTIHNLGYQGLFPIEAMDRIGLPSSLSGVDGLEYYKKANFLKGGLLFSDYLTTVSQRYAQEIQTEEYGHGLEGVIRSRAGRLYGILNGVDYSEWNPESDPLIKENYSAKNLEGKTACKQDLLAAFGLPAFDMDKPLIGIVSRFTDQKGFDLIAEVAGELMKEDLAIVALGTGDKEYEMLFRLLAETNPSRIAVKIAYDNALAHKIEAGADMFLMPSRYEPCGLNQIYSLRYGTVPVVRATGGLDDTIADFDTVSGQGTGFKFKPYTGQAFLECVQRSVAVFRQQKLWRTLQLNGMAKDFSWKASAGAYSKLYGAARRSRIPRAVVTSNA